MVELPNVKVQTGKQHRVNSFIVVGVYYWTTVEWKELFPFSSRIVTESSELWEQEL